MSQIILIGLAGFAGTILRYVVDRRVAILVGDLYPWGTFLVNLSGSFVIGVLFVLFAERAALPATLRGPVMVGFIGAYTTFSTMALDSQRLIEGGSWPHALINLGGSMLAGLLAVAAGMAVARAL